jgi:hypothetical protein
LDDMLGKNATQVTESDFNYLTYCNLNTHR